VNIDDPELERRLVAEVKKVASNIRRLADEQGLSIRKLNQRADLNPSTTFDLLAARTAPNLKTMMQIAMALGVEMRDLLDEVIVDPAATRD